jgi:hypothetical protein
VNEGTPNQSPVNTLLVTPKVDKSDFHWISRLEAYLTAGQGNSRQLDAWMPANCPTLELSVKVV